MCVSWLIRPLPVAFRQTWHDLQVGWCESGWAFFSWWPSPDPAVGWWLPSRWPAGTERKSSSAWSRFLKTPSYGSFKTKHVTLHQQHRHLKKLHEVSWCWFQHLDLNLVLRGRWDHKLSSGWRFLNQTEAFWAQLESSISKRLPKTSASKCWWRLFSSSWPGRNSKGGVFIRYY